MDETTLPPADPKPSTAPTSGAPVADVQSIQVQPRALNWAEWRSGAPRPEHQANLPPVAARLHLMGYDPTLDYPALLRRVDGAVARSTEKARRVLADWHQPSAPAADRDQ